jgi:uncharacterized protein (DUF2267 family)
LIRECSASGARALFIVDWDADEPKRDFEDRALMTMEVRGLRAEHNYAPETAIRDVAVALRRNVDQSAFERVLAIFASRCDGILAIMSRSYDRLSPISRLNG